MIEKNIQKYEKALLIGLITPYQNEDKSKEYLDELEFLAQTAGAKSLGRFTQKRLSPHPRTFIGKGKIFEIKTFIETSQIDTLIFDDELSANQVKNIEKVLNGIKIIDRTQLILDIFAARAQTSYAKTQVELAQYQYLLPRLTHLWTHLERQKGGIGLRGPGETEIETDRRIIRSRISLLKEKLGSIDKQMITQRNNRGKMISVALIGYTNVGKSMLMNVLSKENLLSENKLFATLDTTVRKIIIQNLPFLLSDTIGFIRKLPTQLIESFKSTLDEIKDADILLHVVDISHPNFREQISDVLKILSQIKALDNKPIITLLNKVDEYKIKKETLDSIEDPLAEGNDLEKEKNSLKKSFEPSLFISAKTGENIEALKKLLYKEICPIHQKRFPYNDFLYEIYP